MANDHYVPQCYLRRFRADAGRVWCYQAGRRPSLRGVKSIASQFDYYTLEKDKHGMDSNLVDEYLKAIESHAGPILKKLVTMERLDLSNEEYSDMSMFIASLANRTPAFQKIQIRMHEQSLNLLNDMTTSDPETFRAVAERAGIDVDNEDPELLEATRRYLKKGVRVDVERSKAALLGVAIQNIVDLAALIYCKEWHLLYTEGPKLFITSDNPVVLMPPKGHHPAEGPGFIDSSVLVTLSPNRALLLRNNKAAPGDFFEARQEIVERYNTHVMEWADEQVYASFKSLELNEAFGRIQDQRKILEQRVMSPSR